MSLVRTEHLYICLFSMLRWAPAPRPLVTEVGSFMLGWTKDKGT